jgi:hypothetical protein
MRAIFILGLFNKASNCLEYTALNYEEINIYQKECGGKNWSWPNLRKYAGIFL